MITTCGFKQHNEDTLNLYCSQTTCSLVIINCMYDSIHLQIIDIILSGNSNLNWMTSKQHETRTVSVNITLLLCEPRSCNPAAETALQPLVWCSESFSSQGYSSPEECFFHRHRYKYL